MRAPKTCLTALAACAIAATVPVSAAAQEQQSVCGERETMTDYLKVKYAERQDSMGVTRDGKLMEVFSSEKGTWTMLLSFPDGSACVVGYGQNWQPVSMGVDDKLKSDDELGRD
jgi:hypothetical protein